MNRIIKSATVILCLAFMLLTVALGVFAGNIDSTKLEGSDIAAYASVRASGTCGENVTWVLDYSGTLTLSGTGPMTDYTSDNAPWKKYKSSIKSVVIEEGITTIGNFAFEYTYVTNVTIADSVTRIGASAFSVTRIEKVTIPKNVNKIDNACFFSCNNLSKVIIESEEIELSDQVFDECARLKTAGPIGSGCNIEFCWISHIPVKAFSYCTSLTTITLPNGITTIGDYAFMQTQITSIKIPDSVTSISRSVFLMCGKLTEITIPPNVKEIQPYTFSDCTALKKVVLSNQITSIGDFAFGYCTALTEITIPNSVTLIKSTAFKKCSMLLNIYVDKAEGLLTDSSWGASAATVTYLRKINTGTISDYIYTGNAIMPKVSINEDRKDGTLSKKLIEGTDYIITYVNNINTGTAITKVKYIGDFMNLGTQSINFKIIPKSCAELMIAPVPRQGYTGRIITPALTITDN